MTGIAGALAVLAGVGLLTLLIAVTLAFVGVEFDPESGDYPDYL